jgi:hypothetical protein
MNLQPKESATYKFGFNQPMAWSTTQLGFAIPNALNFPFKLSAVTYLRKGRLFHYFSSNEPEAQLT